MNELKNTIKGTIWAAGDPGFAEASRPWNLAVEQKVVAVVEAADADDVAATVSYAALHGLAVTTQPTGHSASGSADGTILLRTHRLNSVEIIGGSAEPARTVWRGSGRALSGARCWPRRARSG